MRNEKIPDLTKLRNAYDNVKNHSFRVDKKGNMRNYGDMIIELARETYNHLSERFFNKDAPIELYFHVSHDFASMGYHFRTHHESIRLGLHTRKELNPRITHDLLIIERYIHQIHAYLDSGIFTQWEGYYAGCNPHPGWYTVTFNPKTKKFKQVKWVEDKEVNRDGRIKGEKKEEEND